MSKWIKGLKKAKAEAKPIPRATEEIRKEYSDLCMKLGHAQYQVKFNQEVTEQLLSRLAELDGEASARKRLDDEAAAKAKEEAKPPASGVA